MGISPPQQFKKLEGNNKLILFYYFTLNKREPIENIFL